MGRRALNAAVATLATSSLVFCIWSLWLWHESRPYDWVEVWMIYPAGEAANWPPEVLGGFVRITQSIHKVWTVEISIPRAGLLGLGLLCAIPPLFYFGRRIARMIIQNHRVQHGLCLNCGYDIRESPERCPECGQLSTASASNSVPRPLAASRNA